MRAQIRKVQHNGLPLSMALTNTSIWQNCYSSYIWREWQKALIFLKPLRKCSKHFDLSLKNFQGMLTDRVSALVGKKEGSVTLLWKELKPQKKTLFITIVYSTKRLNRRSFLKESLTEIRGSCKARSRLRNSMKRITNFAFVNKISLHLNDLNTLLKFKI